MKSLVDDIADGVENSFSALDLKDRVAIMLLFKEVVTEEQVEGAWQKWRHLTREGANIALWRVLAMEPEVDRRAVFEEAAAVYSFKSAETDFREASNFLHQIRTQFSHEQWDRLVEFALVPVQQVPTGPNNTVRWIFASHDPTRPELRMLLEGLELPAFEIQYAPEQLVQELVDRVLSRRNKYLERLKDEAPTVDLGGVEQEEGQRFDDRLQAEIARSSLLNLFEAMLLEAVNQEATDIHIYQTSASKVEVHFRIDGQLFCWHVLDYAAPQAFLSVAKDCTLGVDRFKWDVAQDGYFQRTIHGRIVRFRVSIVPITTKSLDGRAESIVIRVLDDRRVMTDLRSLGLSESALERFEWAVDQPHGMIIVTGPTGSGKTTTLRAALNQVITPQVNVLTIEDPVEYVLPGARQLKLSHRFELDSALRFVLRHDPDVVMVGEMRDRTTAELAMKLANTGHLTFSTLHTNDAPSAIGRLFKMGIEPFLIGNAINLVVAQRLVRTLCDHCKQPDPTPDPDVLDQLGFSEEERSTATIFRPGSAPTCEHCGGTGQKGRRAITETLVFSDEVHRLILSSHESVDEVRVREIAVAEGMETLRDSARHLVRTGAIGMREMQRVVPSGLNLSRRTPFRMRAVR